MCTSAPTPAPAASSFSSQSSHTSSAPARPAPAPTPTRAPAASASSPAPKRKAYKLVAIGTSTGGPVALQRVAERLALGLQLADAGRRRGELRLQAPEGVQALGLLPHARQHRVQFLERERSEVARVGEAIDVLAELVDRIRVGRRYLKG